MAYLLAQADPWTRIEREEHEWIGGEQGLSIIDEAIRIKFFRFMYDHHGQRESPSAIETETVSRETKLDVPVGPQRSFLRCIKYGAYKHLVPAGIKYGFPPVKDGQMTSAVEVL